MRYIKAFTLTLLISLSFTLPLFGAKAEYDAVVTKFIKTVKSNDRTAIANLVAYPLHRKVPLPAINTPSQFLQYFDEVFDDELLKAISASSIKDDWEAVGWRGIMFNSGALWLNENGKISAINYETEKGRKERDRLVESEKSSLHSSLRKFEEPVLEWKTKDFRIRIDRIGEELYRYAAWPVKKATSEKPDLILNNGKVVFEGSGGNHYYDFKSGVYLYRCDVTVVGADDSPPGDLTVYKNDKEILSQPVIEVIKGW